MNYREGAWHALVGFDPQYEHMKSQNGWGYHAYMEGYNDNVPVDKSESSKDEDGEQGDA